MAIVPAPTRCCLGVTVEYRYYDSNNGDDNNIDPHLLNVEKVSYY